MFDNYPPAVNPASTPDTKPVVDIYAGLAQAPAANGPQLSPQINNQNPYPNLPPAESGQGGGSLKFLVIGLVTLVLVLVGAALAYQMILKPRFSNMELMPELATELEQLSEESFDDLTMVSSTDSSETEITYTSSSTTSTLAMPELGDSAVSSSASVNQQMELDSDNDQLSDDLELLKGTNKNMADTDGDGLTDGQELNIEQTDPLKADTDADGLTDSEEINKYQSKALQADTDGDGFSDGQEVKNNYNPLGSGRLIVPKR